MSTGGGETQQSRYLPEGASTETLSLKASTETLRGPGGGH